MLSQERRCVRKLATCSTALAASFPSDAPSPSAGLQQSNVFCQLLAIRHLRRNAIKWIPASAGIQQRIQGRLRLPTSAFPDCNMQKAVPIGMIFPKGQPSQTWFRQALPTVWLGWPGFNSTQPRACPSRPSEYLTQNYKFPIQILAQTSFYHHHWPNPRKNLEQYLERVNKMQTGAGLSFHDQSTPRTRTWVLSPLQSSFPMITGTSEAAAHPVIPSSG